jgi:hypothetical protein
MFHVKLDARACGDLLSEPDTKATVLHAIILATYGADVLYGGEGEEDDPVDFGLLYADLENDFRCRLPPEVENKIRAIHTAVSTTMFYESLGAFRAITKSLADGDIADLIQGMTVDLTLPEMLWALYEVNLNREEIEEPPLSPAIAKLFVQEIEEWGEEVQDENVTAGAVIYLRNEYDQLLREMGKAGFSPEQLKALIKPPAMSHYEV